MSSLPKNGSWLWRKWMNPVQIITMINGSYNNIGKAATTGKKVSRNKGSLGDLPSLQFYSRPCVEDIKFIKTLSLLLWWDKGQVKVWSACSLFWWHQQREREGGSEGEGGFFLSGKPKSASRTTSWFTSLCCASALNFFFSFFFPNSNSSETFTFWKGMFPGRRLQPSWAPLSSPWELCGELLVNGAHLTFYASSWVTHARMLW